MDHNAVKQELSCLAENRYHTPLSSCTKRQLYELLLVFSRDLCRNRKAPETGRKLYYFSAEFLIGKLLSNNLLALGIFDPVRKVLEELGCSLEELEEEEPEPALGNGGLGRLAACFLDSAAALGLPGDGVGLLYHYGLFRQEFESNRQVALPDEWIRETSWLIPTDLEFSVPFGTGSLKAKMFDLAIPGACNQFANRLHLFDVEQPAEPPETGICFDQTDIPHHLTSFLYPDDSSEAGRMLRIYQQYFLVSAGAQLILREMEERGYPVSGLSDHVVVQINDTHPSMVIPELIRLLTEQGLSMDEAIEQVKNTCAYTNHTILAEALETWPVRALEQVAPQIVPILRELDRRVRAQSPDPAVAIVDRADRVHMAHLDLHYGFSVNGVAQLHTEILKHSELKPFHDLYPEKFNNKTNGISFRRWLEACNPALTALIDRCIGTDWRREPEHLQRLLAFREDEQVLRSLQEVKRAAKLRLCDRIRREQHICLDPDSIFDIQIKRLHEYKRQQMNALSVIDQYLQIKAGRFPEHPVTVIFGGKAAPAYVMARNIIHLILCLQELVESDPRVRPWLRVVMVENYNVSWASDLIPACDISEQISLASREASGTGNMKLMANGAVTLGTMDGANVEIAQLVGLQNLFPFGESSSRVLELYRTGGYHAQEYYNRDTIRPLVDFLVSEQMRAIGDESSLRALWTDLQQKDWFMTLLDLEQYLQTKNRAIHAYGDRMNWARTMLVNIAMSGFFSSDRTVRQYNEDIWHLTGMQN